MTLQKCDDCGCVINDETDIIWDHNKGYGATLYLCEKHGFIRRVEEMNEGKKKIAQSIEGIKQGVEELKQKLEEMKQSK